MRGDEQQAEDVGQPQPNQADQIPTAPRARTVIEEPGEAVAGGGGDGGFQRERPGVLAEPADRGYRREAEPGGQPGRRSGQPPAQRGEQARRGRHGHRGGQPQRQFTAAGHPDQQPDEQVVRPVHRVHVTQHVDQLGEGPVRGGQRRALVPPERRHADPPQHDGRGGQRGAGREQPGRAAGRRRAGGVRGRRRAGRRGEPGDHVGPRREWCKVAHAEQGRARSAVANGVTYPVLLNPDRMERER